ncbi:MAG: glycosyltransferase [Pseudomonas sp.]|jgi:glycosyltransferase involved in cell wall biosynthesis|uniref:glycosyltransferase n=1 Tax=Pseudomonas sp. TaxID=306 RepID=UPI003982C29D
MSQTIIQVVQHLAPGGIECMVLDLLKHATAEQTVHVVSLEGNAAQMEYWPRLKPYASRLHFLNKAAGISPALIWKLRGLLRTLKADVVHTHHIGPLLYGGAAARLAGVPILLHTEHDAWHLQDPKRRRLAKLLLAVLSPSVIADSQQVQAQMRAMLPSSNPQVILNGIDVQRFKPCSQRLSRERLGLPVDVKLVGCAARLETVKGHQDLLDALFRLPMNVHLALAGDGSLRESLEAQAVELGQQHRIHFLGHVEAMPDFYRALDVFCLASMAEGMPLSLLEAQACGVPVVATRVGGVAEAVCPLSGVLVRAGHSGELARALKYQFQRQPKYDPRPFVLSGKRVQDMVHAYALLGAGVRLGGAHVS